LLGLTNTDDADYGQDEDFVSIGAGELLELDPRPTFALSVDSDFDTPFEPAYLNSSLLSDPYLIKTLSFKTRSLIQHPTSKVSNSEFKSWVKGTIQRREIGSSYSFAGVLWTAFLLRNWIIISGDHATTTRPNTKSLQADPNASSSPGRQTESSSETTHQRPRRVPTNDDNSLLDNNPGPLEADFQTPGTPDWTLAEPVGQLSHHIIFARSIDWAATPLGDMSTWSREFRQIVCLVMANPHPVALFWGIYSLPLESSDTDVVIRRRRAHCNV
jgi:hypothetical protein